MSKDGNQRIFLSAPDIRERERDYVLAAIDSGWVAPAGPELDEFERALAERSGRSHAVALSSGTAAIHLALLGLGVGSGDEVICSTLTFIGSANPIVYCGAHPVFVDSEPGTWNMDPELLRRLLDRRVRARRPLPKAAIVVDLYGACANYAEIEPILGLYGIPLIEDAAEALGATYQGRPAGSFGHCGVFSFNGNKIITSGGGGALVTDDAALADRARYLSTQARQPTSHYEHTEIGFNYRMSSLAAAFGRAQLETLDERIARRSAIHEFYRRVAPKVGLELAGDGVAGSNFWLTCGTFDRNGAHRSRQLIDHLDSRDIESRPVWKPMHLQPVFRDAAAELSGVARGLFERGVCLPSGSGMTDDDLARIESALLSVPSRRKRAARGERTRASLSPVGF